MGRGALQEKATISEKRLADMMVTNKTTLLEISLIQVQRVVSVEQREPRGDPKEVEGACKGGLIHFFFKHKGEQSQRSLKKIG